MKDTSNSRGYERFQEKALEFPLAYSCIQYFLAEFPEEGHLLLPHMEKKQAERKQRVDRIANLLTKGENTLTLDAGCMCGQMSNSLQIVTGGRVVGVDDNATSIAKAQTMANESIDYIAADFVEWDIPAVFLGRFDQVVASNFLHEVYSKYGEVGFTQAIRKASLLLKKGGRLVIMDGVHPKMENVSIRFRDEQTREQFRDFTNLYKARDIPYIAHEDGTITIDNAKFVRFLNCLRFVIPGDLRAYEATLRDIQRSKERIARSFYILDYYTLPRSTYSAEFKQDFTFYSDKKLVGSLQSLGFKGIDVRVYNERIVEEYFWRSGIEFPNGELPKIRIQIVGEKI